MLNVELYRGHILVEHSAFICGKQFILTHTYSINIPEHFIRRSQYSIKMNTKIQIQKEKKNQQKFSSIVIRSFYASIFRVYHFHNFHTLLHLNWKFISSIQTINDAINAMS